MQQELGVGANIGEFAAKFLGLFGGKIRGTVPQKAACLKLFAAYTGTTWSKESDIPPADRELFRAAWGEDEQICRECGGISGSSGMYCSSECEAAGTKVVCRQCKTPLDHWFPHCPDCSVGGGPSDGLLAYRDRICEPGSFEAVMKRRVETLALAHRAWSSDLARDEGHEPAWKRRRRA